MEKKLIIIRGIVGSGKSTLAENLRAHFPKKTAVIHTSLFYWEIVKGDNPQKALENVFVLLKNYMKQRYNIILEGTLYLKDLRGVFWTNKFDKLGTKNKYKVHRFFLKADLNELKNREKKRKKLSLTELKRYHKKTIATLSKQEEVVDTTNLTPKQVVDFILKKIKS